MTSSGNQTYGSSLPISSHWSLPSGYDVYFSFRSIDTGTIFVDHLRTALSSKGIQTVCYESVLEQDFIPSIFLSTIAMSKIIVVVISENYASSHWCLDELVEILELKREGNHHVVSVFYNVDPLDVRQQTGEFGKAFQKHMDMENKDVGQQTGEFGQTNFQQQKDMKKKLETWKAALAEIGNLPGYQLPFSPAGVDNKFLSQIEKTVLSQIEKTVLHDINLESASINMESGYTREPSLIKIINIGTRLKEVQARFLNLRTTNLNRFKWQNIVKMISRGLEDFSDIAPGSMRLLERLSSQDFTENTSKPESLQNQNLSAWQSPLSERSEVQVDFHDFPERQGILSDKEELLSLIEKVSEDKLLKSKSVSVLNLNVIRLRDSKLLEIPENFSFPDLKMIFLLNLDYIPPSFFERMPALEILDMSDTSIDKLPVSISKLIKLKELLLRRCELLTELPHEIGELVSLKVLDISGCRNLVGIPESINSLQSLSSVDLRDCKIMKNLPESIRKMRSLQNLYLSGCSSLVEFHRPEFSINRVSSTSQADKMEVRLDFHKCEGTLLDIRELLSLMENVSSYEFLISKSVAVRSLKVIHVRNSELPEIPVNLCFPDLEKLFLDSNLDLSYIPSTFFKGMPAIKVLDLSNTRIKTLPPFVSKLTELEQLILQRCQLLIELPPEIGALENLKVLDLEGTGLAYLPAELEKLINLKCLKVSLYDAESYRKTKKISSIIPVAKLSKLNQLEDLSINIDPQSLWCSAAVKIIMEDLPSLNKLKTLKLYLPTAELLKSLVELRWNKDGLSIYPNLSNFNVIFGPYGQRFISRIPCDFEEEFLKLKKCLKYINGKENTSEFAEAVKHANALYLDRHWTIQKLSVFKLGELNELKFCLLVDCNEMKMVFDESDYSVGVANKGENLHSLEYLAIHYLEKLEVICKGPGASCCLQSLKVLVLHMCPSLITIFTPELLEDLVNLEEMIVEDCPKVQTLVVADKSQSISKKNLFRLKKLSLLYLPQLVSISGDFSMGRKLENIVVYDCPMLKRLPSVEVFDKDAIEVKGEMKWWNALEWYESGWSAGQPYYLREIPELDIDGDFLEEFAPKFGNSLRLFVEECDAN
ncbi:hypothetical protein AgCh_022745 [Apium graveolens]